MPRPLGRYHDDLVSTLPLTVDTCFPAHSPFLMILYVGRNPTGGSLSDNSSWCFHKVGQR